MSNGIVVGTVRGRNEDGTYVVVKRSGRTLNVTFDGPTPTLGADVIGNVVETDGQLTMSLKNSVAEAMLEGDVEIIPVSQRTDISVQVLARMFERSKSAVFRPGSGMAIERSPRTSDPDVAWAMESLRPEAERLGLALNVIDVQAVTRSKWDMRSLQSFSLPADIEGSRKSKDDLTRILRSGFHPACSRIIERFTGRNEISVNFIVPYAPFVGALGFARDIAGMNIGVFPVCDLNISEARRLSSARQMAMGIAHNRLSPGQGHQADIDSHPRVRHLSNCFSDAVAALFFLRDGGRRAVIEQFAALREASIFFGFDEGTGGLKPGVLENATSNTLKTVLEVYDNDPVSIHTSSAKELVTRAVRVAKATAFEGRRFTDASRVGQQEMEAAVQSANKVAVDLHSCSHEYLDQLSEVYRRDIEALTEEHSNHPLSARRLVTFAAVYAPHRMEDIFSDATSSLDGIIATASDNSFADRVRQAVGKRPMDIEFADAPPVQRRLSTAVFP